MRYKAVSEKQGHAVDGPGRDSLIDALADLREQMRGGWTEKDGFRRKIVLYLSASDPFYFIGEIFFYHDSGVEEYERLMKDGAG